MPRATNVFGPCDVCGVSVVGRWGVDSKRHKWCQDYHDRKKRPVYRENAKRERNRREAARYRARLRDLA